LPDYFLPMVLSVWVRAATSAVWNEPFWVSWAGETAPAHKKRVGLKLRTD
jgi:hypothetical protein